MSQLSYRIDVQRPALRTIAVTLRFAGDWGTGEGSLSLFVPAWTPGSYLIRDFARHFGPVLAADDASGTPLECRKQGMNRYQVAAGEAVRRIRVEYTVYAHELSVRTAHFDREFAFWNPANILLWPVGRRDIAARFEVLVPEGWDLACPLRPERTGGGAFRFEASGIDEAMDAPCLAARLAKIEWQVRGVSHRALLAGHEPVVPPERLRSDLSAISEQAARVFGFVPYPDYSFLVMCSDAGRGGLEHANCSVLQANRSWLVDGKDYRRRFLGLAAHELFHAWNVKRMRPDDLWEVDYERAAHSELLWLAEGFTAYYDDRICLLAGILELSDYLEILGKNATSMLSAPGRGKQSLCEASHDAWIRFYRPDEDTRNSTQNYYVNGSLVALAWDSAIRRRSAGTRSLDDFLRTLWRETFEKDRGYTMADVESALREALLGDDAATRALLDLVRRPLDLDLEPFLEPAGLSLSQEDPDKPYLGIGFRSGSTEIAYVNDGSPAQEAGLAPGDEILALDGLRVLGENWGDLYRCLARVGRPIRILVSSHGRIAERSAVPSVSAVGTWKVALVESPTPEQIAFRERWFAPAARQHRGGTGTAD
ncbi:MAG: PDZ domain-containing protein [Planctomycetota bacterium]